MAVGPPRPDFLYFRLWFTMILQNPHIPKEINMLVRTIDQLIAVLELWKANLPTYQAEVGASVAEITWTDNTVENLNYLRNYASLFEANKQTVVGIKNAVFNGGDGNGIKPFPVTPAGAAPFPLAEDVLGEFQRLRGKYKKGAGYNTEIGEALGIATDTSASPDPGNVTPIVDASAAQLGYLYSVVVSNRADADQFEVSTAVVGSSDWTIVGTFTGRSTDLTYNPGPTDGPVQIQIRIRLKLKNQYYGLISDVVTITVNP